MVSGLGSEWMQSADIKVIILTGCNRLIIEMKEDVLEARQLVRAKKNDLQVLDEELQRELNNQQLLQQLMGQQSISQSSYSHSSKQSEPSQVSIASAWLIDQIQRVNQFVANCRLANTSQTNLIKPQTQEETLLEFNKTFNQQQFKAQPPFFQSTHPKPIPQTFSRLSSINYTQYQCQQIASKKEMQQSLRQQQLKLQRQAIRQAIINEEQTKNYTNHTHPPKPQKLQAEFPLVNQFYLTNKTKNQGIESFKRKRAMERVVADIRSAKDKATKIQQSIARHSALIRF